MSGARGSSVVQSLFDAALEDFERQTGTNFAQHPLTEKLDTCNSVESITAALQEQAQVFRRFRGDGGKVVMCLKGVVRVLHSLSTSGVLGEGIGLSFPPAKAIFAGIGILLSAIQDVDASYEALGDLFKSIENFLKRLDIYASVTLTPAMCEMIVQILVELLSTFALATKEIKQGRLLKFGKKLLGENDIEAVVQRLDRLTLDEARMTAAQTLEVVCGLIQNISVVKEDNRSLRDDVQEALAMVQKIASEIKQSRRREIQKWLSPPDPWKNYNIARESLHQGTARWFTEGDIFAEWKATSSLMWIHGKPGSGKSVLSSAIIQDVEERLSDGSASMAFFFFDFRDDEKQTRRSLLSSLLVQFCNQSDDYCDVLFKFYSDHNNGSRHPSDNKLTECLEKVLNSQNADPIYIIVDALDECPSFGMPSARVNVLKVVTGLVDLRCPNLHICVTSRPEPDIEAILCRFASRVSLHNQDGQTNDINNYVRDIVTTDPAMRRWRAQDREHVINTLSQRADGMFRWVFCQLEYLRDCLPQRIRRALDELPETLDETYTRTLQRISKARQEHARRLFQCVAVASRPLRVEELAEFLAFEFGEGSIPEFNPDWRPENPADEVLTTCSSLIAIVNVGGYRVIQFSHYSVKEYLVSKRIAEAGNTVSQYQVLMSPAHIAVAQACLAVLLKLSPNSNTSTIEEVPLAHYASQHWLDHALFENVSLDIQDGLTELFDPNKPHFVVWAWICDTIPGFSVGESFNGVSRLSQILLDDRIFRDFREAGVFTVTGYSPASDIASWPRLADHAYANARAKGSWTPRRRDEHVAHLGDVCAISKDSKDVNAWDTGYSTPLAWALDNKYLEFAWVLLKYGSNWKARDGHGKTPLHWASEKGLPGVCQFVIDSGGDVNDRDDHHRVPLHCASGNGHLEVFWVLLAHGANVDSLDNLNKTPLYLASENGHPDVAQTLLARGANVDSLDNLNKTPLYLASEYGHLDVAQTLLAHGANADSPDSVNTTPLHLASENGDLEVARVLLTHGANVNSRDSFDKTPLHLASANRYLEVARLLLVCGANVDSLDSLNTAPLHLASENGDLNVARVLLAHGANVDSRDIFAITPLHLASQNGHQEVVRFLLARGANIDSWDSSKKTPLGWASVRGQLQVVRVLLALGANIDSRDSSNRTPWRWAVENGHPEIVQFLLAHGANVDSRGSSNKTPLHWASEYGHLEIVQFLVMHGANADSRDSFNRVPLHLASENGHLEVVQVLLNHGADTSCRDNDSVTPIFCALTRGHETTVCVLAEHVADVDDRDDRGRAPLHWASLYGYKEATRILLSRGADARARDVRGKTPLHLVSLRGHVEVARLLLERGADGNACDKYNRTPLHVASEKGHLGVTQILLDHGVDPSPRDTRNWTPLHLASQGGDVKLIEMLIQSGADIRTRTNDGQSPSQLARGHRAAQLLSEHGAQE